MRERQAVVSNSKTRKGRFATGVIYKKNDGAFSGKEFFVRFKRLAFRETAAEDAILPHRHMDYELILLCRGSYRTTINQTQITLAPGEGVLVKPGDLHQDERPAGAQFAGLAFTLQSVADADKPLTLFADHVPAGLQKFCLKLAPAMALLRQLEKQSRTGGEFAEQIKDALTAAVFWQTLNGLPPKALSPQFLSKSDDGSFKDQLTRLLLQHLDADLDLYTMAAELKMSRTTLVNKCKDWFGLPPGRIFNELRMEHGCYLLANSTLSVKEIAGRLGYASEFAFTRAFHRHAGCPPRSWRRNYIYEK